MWIVRLALRRPYAFVVASILILGLVSIVRTPVDIFPNIDIPVIVVAWPYTGLSPEMMSNRVVFNYERSLTTTVNDIEHIDSQSLAAVAIVKIYFHPHVQVASPIAQVTAISPSTVRQLPPGITPPFNRVASVCHGREVFFAPVVFAVVHSWHRGDGTMRASA